MPVFSMTPHAPATEKQKAIMEAKGIPFAPDITKEQAFQLIADSLPNGGKKLARRRQIYRQAKPSRYSDGKTHLSGYLTKAELAANIGAITKQVSEQLMKGFLEDAPLFYEALAKLRDKDDPDIRAVVYGLDRIMGKMTEKSENKNLNIIVPIKEIHVHLDGDNDNANP